MAGQRLNQNQMVFGLDIGTRSIVGTVGYMRNKRFYVVAERTKEHETRAMRDGQIHDIIQVGNTIASIKKELEEAIGGELTEVCIAAAGRVLRTVTTRVEHEFSETKVVKDEDIRGLVSMGVERAYEEFSDDNEEDDLKFYCVGNTVIRYYLNGTPIGSLEEHKAKTIGADIIATFLPDEVVDGLYRAVELAGLHVANLTLEPIAAIQLAIPEKFRLLNIALVDVGAGTSDISITKEGSIVAYGMIPVAGDSITEVIAAHCLVDFAEAEKIKMESGEKEEIQYEDILCLTQTISAKEVHKLVEDKVEDMAKQVAECIRKLNGDAPVSAVFVVGGGGIISGYTDALADNLGILRERVAIRGPEVMQQIEFLEEGVKKDSLLITPIGICLNFYEQVNNFVFLTFNGQRVKIYDNGHLAVVDAAMQSEFPQDCLFPRRGEELNFILNGKPRIVRGQPGEAAAITVNGSAADIYTPIHSNDVIVVKESTAGEPARMLVEKLPEFKENIQIYVDEKKILLPKFPCVNGELKSGFYSIQSGDEVEMRDFYTVEQVLEFLDVEHKDFVVCYVNNKLANKNTEVYENFTISLMDAPIEEEVVEETTPDETYEEEAEESVKPQAENTEQNNTVEQGNTDTIQVLINKSPVMLSGKVEYVFVDIFDYIDFDLSQANGRILVTTVNGAPAKYMEAIHNGDIIEVYWRTQKS